MDEFERHERKRQAWMRLRAQRQRAGELRGRVVAVSLVCFALLWAVVFAQMVSGNDPVLSAKAAAQTTSRTKERKKLRAEARARAEAEDGEVEFLPLEEGEVLEPEAIEPEEELGLEAVEPEEELGLEAVEPEEELEPLITGQS